jgi:redox-sensitive bicupin YhaK (pirin superfamily)
MTIEFSTLVAAQSRGAADAFAVSSIDTQALGHDGPIVVLDHFRVTGRPFTPHPHAGFSTVTYVFEDSESGLRSRDSLGNDFLTEPGGIVWTQAGSGVIHEELPAQPDRQLHGMQIFVNLSARNKLAAPRALRLDRNQIPQVRTARDDRVRVAVGTYGGVMSPLVPAEPFTLLEVELLHEIPLDIRDGHHTLIYAIEGRVGVHTEGRELLVPAQGAMALRGNGLLKLRAEHPSRLLVMSGLAISEPVIARGTFIMNSLSQIDDAIARYNLGEMGQLAPLAAEAALSAAARATDPVDGEIAATQNNRRKFQ